MLKADSLTILSVASADEIEYLGLNFELAKKMNDNAIEWQWAVIDNTTIKGKNVSAIKDKRFTILKGVDDRKVPETMVGSYHHSDAVNANLKNIKTHYLLLLDPDFYVIKKNWISEMITYLKDHNLSFLGVPWHPKHPTKYRYFPCIQWLLIDLKKVNREELDFSPNLIEAKLKKKKPALSVRDSLPKRVAKTLIQAKPVRKYSDLLYLALHHRKSVGCSKDTGYQFFADYYQNPNHSYQLIQPVFKFWEKNPETEKLNLKMSRYFEKFLPDRLCYIPKKKGYFSKKGFKEFGYPDLYKLGYEEFLWQKEPFAFHLRKFLLAIYPNVEKRIEKVKEVLNEFLLDEHKAGVENGSNRL